MNGQRNQKPIESRTASKDSGQGLAAAKACDWKTRMTTAPSPGPGVGPFVRVGVPLQAT